MAISLNYFLLGEAGGINQNTGKIDLHGIFDVVTSPIYPLGISNLVGICSFDGVERDTLFELRINSPEEEILAKMEFGVPAQYPGLSSKQVIGLQNIVISKRGKYTVDILEKNPTGYKFVKSVTLFTAIYPPKRRFAEGEIDAILSKKEELIVTVKTDYTIPGKEEVKKFQINLDPTAPFEEGYEAFPENNQLEIDGQIYDLEGVRRNAEWLFGKVKPKQTEEETN
ncbi:MAG: hypothetical protein JXM74_06425 [Fusobacteriaceae bacterium]|nr:hypothetical protein [Fusobacteriaceae bacterium]MBN2838375.1 hypothetical protein [Fusobacteriaceae bacterium]